MKDFSHYNDQGRPQMVNISEKQPSVRTATATSRVRLSKTLYEAIHSDSIQKGDPLPVAQVAGIMAAKKNVGVDSDVPSDYVARNRSPLYL